MKMPKPKGNTKNPDPSYQRCGIILDDEEVRMKILQACADAKKLISPLNVENRIKADLMLLDEAIQELRGALIIGYDDFGCLPSWEPALVILNDKTDILELEEFNKEVKT